MVPLLNAVTGQQERDQATGLPMWLIVGDDSGTVVLGTDCQPFDVAPSPTATSVCVETATLMSLLNANTGEQERDQATGLPMWLRLGDDSGTVVLGTLCEAPPTLPLGLPATGDGTAPIVDEDYEVIP